MKKPFDPTNEVDCLVRDHFGGSSRAAWERLGIARQTLNDWRHNGIPELRRYQIREITSARQGA